MPDNNDTVECGECGTLIDSQRDTEDHRISCPNCGSNKRNYHVSITDTMVARDGLGIKAKRPGEKRPFIEDKAMPDFSQSRGKVVLRKQVIDRDNDKYFESVTDYESGEVIHHCDEPLSEHRGHGSAKAKKE
ncbi:MAG: zinc ribbon domain-containing protein [Syntrophobacteraceae bacterium]